jgi:hypothetical protein
VDVLIGGSGMFENYTRTAGSTHGQANQFNVAERRKQTIIRACIGRFSFDFKLSIA